VGYPARRDRIARRRSADTVMANEALLLAVALAVAAV